MDKNNSKFHLTRDSSERLTISTNDGISVDGLRYNTRIPIRVVKQSRNYAVTQLYQSGAVIPLGRE